MLMGVMLKMLNAIHFRSATDFFFEWVPQIFFLCSTFGYMVILIFMKWSLPWQDQTFHPTADYPISSSPNIITIFIGFLLRFGEYVKNNNNNF